MPNIRGMLSALYTDTPLYRIRKEEKLPAVPENFNGLAIAIPVEADAIEREQLNKIIQGALKLPIENCWILNSEGQLSFSALRAAKTKRLLIFGMVKCLPQLNISWKKNEAVELMGLRILCSDRLDKLAKDTEAKKIFWNALKLGFL